MADTNKGKGGAAPSGRDGASHETGGGTGSRSWGGNDSLGGGKGSITSKKTTPSTPPGPDYVSMFKEYENARRAYEASKYNSAISGINSQFQNAYNDANSWLTKLKTANYWDLNNLVPSSSMNFNGVIQSGLNGLNYQNPNKPTFSDSMSSFTMPSGLVYEPYATGPGQRVDTSRLKSWDFTGASNAGKTVNQNITGLVMPDMVEGPDMALAQKARDAYTEALNTYNSLRSQYDNEYSRISDFANANQGFANNLLATLDGLDIGDYKNFGQFEAQIKQGQNQLSNFKSPILNDYTGFGALSDPYSQAMSKIGQLRNDYAAEQSRIGDFRTDLRNRLTGLDTGADNISIADLDSINNYKQQLNALSRDLSGFSSLLNPDFGYENRYVNDVLSELSGIESRRNSELSRISDFERSLMNTAGNLNSLASSTGVENMSMIQALLDRYNAANSQATGFSSLLPYDLSEETAALTGSYGAIQDLLSRRNQAIGDISSEGQNLLTRLSGTALQDEYGIRDILNSLNSYKSQAGRFTGDDAADMQTAIRDAYNQANGKLNQLYTKRNDIESQAQALLAKMRDTGYLNLDQLGIDEETLAALMDDQSTYNAMQAGDEISSLTRIRDRERGRLEKDAAAVAEQQRIEQEEIKKALAGLLNTGDGRISNNDYARWLSFGGANQSDDDRQTSFASNLNLWY